MKCTNCGGEVDSQAIRCPYCGGRNEAGIVFYKEVYQKVNRNKLLAPLLLRQKTPELIQRMLTRIIVAMGILSVVLMGISIMLYVMIDDPIYSDAQPEPDSYATEYAVTMNNYYYRDWAANVSAFLESWNGDGQLKSYVVSDMLKSGFRVYYDNNMDEHLQQQARLEVDALLEGMLRLSQEELELFYSADTQNSYVPYPDPDDMESLEAVIKEKLAVRLQGGEQ